MSAAAATSTGLHHVNAPPPPPPPGPPPKSRKPTKKKPKWATKLDMYAKVPADMLEGTKSGSYLSIICVSVLLALIFMETKSFLYQGTIKNLSLDLNKDPRVRVNFNITMMDLKCDYLTVDVVSFLGTNQNVTQHIMKQTVTADGVRKRYAGRNVQQHDVVLRDDAVVETIDELHENGEDAISLDETTIKFARREYDFLFVDFFASWCSHCQALAPTWEVLAEVMNSAARASVDSEIEGREHEYSKEDYDAAVKLAMPAMIAKVDCVTHKDLCMDQMIRGYPTLRLFVHDKQTIDYEGPRTVLEMTNWLATKEEEHKNDDAQIKLDDAHEIARDRLGGDSRDEMNSPPERPTNDCDGATAIAVPGLIQAENYCHESGVQLEPTGDADGGQNLAYLDPGDYAEYKIEVAASGHHTFKARVASAQGSGQMTASVDGTVIATINVPNTGGWQTYTTLSASVALKAGTHRLRLDFSGNYVNVNWISFDVASGPSPVLSTGGRSASKSKEEEEWVQKMARYRSRQRAEWHDEEHPGCQITGFLMVDRVPGNFHLQARSPMHDFAAHMTNVSHEVHHLSFGSPAVKNEIKYGHTLAPSGFLAGLSPMDGNVYVTHNEHEAYHHYLKVISTDVGSAGSRRSLKTPEQRRAYRILQSSQLSFYHTDQVPEAKFSYDLSPIAVAYVSEPRRWYDYVTSIMAIVGGVFTVFGMLEGMISAVTTRGGRRR